MIIGIDASGGFAVGGERAGLKCSAVAAAVVPAAARREIDEWTRSKLGEWRRDELKELHAQEMSWDQRLEACQMLGERSDVHVAVCWTCDALLRSAPAVAAHRTRQLEMSEEALGQARSEAGRRRGESTCLLLDGRRVGRNLLTDSDYVRAAMTPRAIMGAVQRALCFYAEDRWRKEMSGFELVMDRDTPASVRYLNEMLLPTVAGDPRFQVITPDHWRDDPVHPLLAGVRHPDGDGYLAKGLLGERIRCSGSHEEPAIQVADVAGWVVCRAISHPDEVAARECFELLRETLAGERGRCFDVFAIGEASAEDEALFAYLHSERQPEQWLMRPWEAVAQAGGWGQRRLEGSTSLSLLARR